MNGTQLTLSTGTVISLGLRGNTVVAHAKNATLAENRGAIITRPVTAEVLATQLGLNYATLTMADAASITAALGKVS